MLDRHPPSADRKIGDHARRIGVLEREKHGTEWEDVGGTGGGGGIQFDTAPQTGNWLYVQTTGAGTPRGYGIEIDEPNGNGVIVNSPFIELGDIDEASNGATFRIVGGNIRADVTGNASFQVCRGYNGPRIIRAGDAAGAMVLGFYGATAVPQAAAPASLGDVITVLQNLGLTA